MDDLNKKLRAVREEFELAVKLGNRFCIDSAMLNVTAAIAAASPPVPQAAPSGYQLVPQSLPDSALRAFGMKGTGVGDAGIRAMWSNILRALRDTAPAAPVIAAKIKPYRERFDFAGVRHSRLPAVALFHAEAEIADLRAVIAQAAPGEPVPRLAVWYGSLPESNGKSNYTAILHRADAEGFDRFSGMTIAQSEYPDRVRYEADCVRHLIGELAEAPDILAYDADKHSGYAAPVAHLSDTTPNTEAPSEDAKERICHKLESPCGSDPWGWCQECPKRAALSAQQAGASDARDAGEVHDLIADAVRGALAGNYYCDRVWSAWQVGTMSEDDFTPSEDVEEVVDGVADAVIAALAAQKDEAGQ